MHKRTLLSFMALIAIVASIGYATTAKLEGVKCLIAGGKEAVEEKSAEWKEGKVYFCCDSCKGKFEKATKEEKEKLAAKANHQLAVSKQYAQQACPISGGSVDAATAIEVDGTKIAFCCKNCKGTAEQMKAEEKVEKLFGEEAFKKAKFEKVKEEK